MRRHLTGFGTLLVLLALLPSALAAQTVTTNDGLSLTFTDTGALSSASVGETAVPLLAGRNGGFFIYPVDGVKLAYARTTFYPGTPILGTVTQEGANLRLTGTAEDQTFSILLRGGLPYLKVDATVTGNGEDHAFLVDFRLPVDAQGWAWADDLYTTRTITTEVANWYFTNYHFWQSRHPDLSANPFATITRTAGPAMGLSLSPLFYPPSAYATQYNGQFGLRIQFELGTTPKTLKHPNTADFHFVLYTHDPAWGNRSAVARYHSFFPEWFLRVSPGGNWGDDSGDQLTTPEDFALKYLETYDWDNSWTTAHSIYTMKYEEPWCWHLSWMDNGALEAAARSIPENAAPYCPAKGQSIAESAQQTVLSGAKNPDGSYLGPDEPEFWTDGTWQCDGAIETVRYITNPDPEIANSRLFNPGRNRGESVAYWEWYRQWGMDPGTTNRYSGLYHDSTTGWWSGWGAVHNFAPEHWATYDYSPGLYAGDWRDEYAPGQVCMWAPYSDVEFLKYAHEQMRREGRPVMANSGPNYELFLAAPFLDMIGAGESYDWSSTRHQISLLRAIAGPKPMSYLNTPRDEATLLACLPFAVYPGLGYLESSGLEPVRALYQQYMPLFNALDAAGWQPLTAAVASASSLLLERFGPDASGTVYFVLRAGEAGPAQVTLYPERFGWDAIYGLGLHLTMLLGGTPSYAFDGSGHPVLDFGELSAGEDRVFALTFEGASCAPVASFAASTASGPAALAVDFTDTSTGLPTDCGSYTTWYWRFGDGFVSTEQHPSHTYFAGGSYTVSLTVTTSAGLSDTEAREAFIIVQAAPLAEFTGVPANAVAPFDAKFTDRSRFAPTAWLWTFGDGATSTLQDPTHTYTTPGLYTVTLRATNAQGENTRTHAGYVHVATFPDVLPEYWSWQEVESCVRADVVTGYKDGTYQPRGVVNRAQMAAYVARALVGGDANVPSGPAVASFSDVPKDFWAYDYVEYAVSADVVKGYKDGTYQPWGAVNRAQMAAFIARAVAGGDALVPTGPAVASFPDVPTTNWAYNYVEYCKDQDIVRGYKDGTYHPEFVVNRDQMAVYIARAFTLRL